MKSLHYDYLFTFMLAELREMEGKDGEKVDPMYKLNLGGKVKNSF